MKEELLSQEDNVEDLKSKFLDADIDHSGTLTIDEIFSVLLRLGAELTIDELVELMNEIDVDRNGTLDIDEFIALMTTTGDEIQFESAGAKNTLMNIKRARRLNPLDFFKNFKMMPSNFVPSFFAERWGKKLNLPSTVFMP
jgi:EF-hand domain pair